MIWHSRTDRSGRALAFLVRTAVILSVLTKSLPKTTFLESFQFLGLPIGLFEHASDRPGSSGKVVSVRWCLGLVFDRD